MYEVFSAKELGDLKARCDVVFRSALENMHSIQNKCMTMSGIVASEDSKLGSVWEGVSNSMKNPTNKIESTYQNTINALQKYIDETVVNESNAEKKVNDLGADLDALANASENLTSRTSSGGSTMSNNGHVSTMSNVGSITDTLSNSSSRSSTSSIGTNTDTISNTVSTSSTSYSGVVAAGSAAAGNMD